MENMLATTRSLEPRLEHTVESRSNPKLGATGSLLIKVKELLKQASAARIKRVGASTRRLKATRGQSGPRGNNKTCFCGCQKAKQPAGHSLERCAASNVRTKPPPQPAKVDAKSFCRFHPDIVRQDTRVRPGSKRINTKSFVAGTTADMSTTSRTAASRKNVGEDFTAIATTRVHKVLVREVPENNVPPRSATHAHLKQFNFVRRLEGASRTQKASFLAKLLRHVRQAGQASVSRYVEAIVTVRCRARSKKK